MNWRNLADLRRTIVSGLPRLRVGADCIVGVPRSGILAGSILAKLLSLPLSEPESFVRGRLWRKNRAHDARGIDRVLLIDDSMNLGGSMAAALDELRVWTRVEFIRVAVYGRSSSVSSGQADIVLEALDGDRIFEWNLWQHALLEQAILDIDGVLCRDPTAEENDGGSGYRRFLETAEPLYLPARRVLALATSRLEKYRPQTEAWLARHGLRYGHLFMADSQERLQAGMHSRLKGQLYAKSDARLFIESDHRQAPQIAEISRKPVICTETAELHPGS